MFGVPLESGLRATSDTPATGSPPLSYSVRKPSDQIGDRIYGDGDIVPMDHTQLVLTESTRRSNGRISKRNPTAKFYNRSCFLVWKSRNRTSPSCSASRSAWNSTKRTIFIVKQRADWIQCMYLLYSIFIMFVHARYSNESARVQGVSDLFEKFNNDLFIQRIMDNHYTRLCFSWFFEKKKKNVSTVFHLGVYLSFK